MVPESTYLTAQEERTRRTVLFIDVVESTRLLEQNEHDAIARWRELLKIINTSLLPKYAGRLVNSLGDGLLLDFGNVPSALSAAFAIMQASRKVNQEVPPERKMLLRMGIEVSDVIIDQHDVYGRGVMLGARLMTLAGPNEIVISSRVRGELTPGLDAEVEDLGECYVKNLQHTLRAFRIGPPGPRPLIQPIFPQDELLPSLAIIPFTARFVEPEYEMLGDVLAEELIGLFSRSLELNVISRLSTAAFRGRDSSHEEMAAYLNANYVLSGAYRVNGEKLTLDCELSERASKHVVWSQRCTGKLTSIIAGDQELIGRVVAGVSTAVLSRELQRAHSQSLPQLGNYTLLMGAIAHMHRLSLDDFNKAHLMLQTLIDRAARLAIPHAWLAKWYVLRTQQGWSSDPDKDAHQALESTKRALNADPTCSLALAINGLVHTHMLKRFDLAQESYERAIQSNPNDSLAWLLRGAQHAFTGDGIQAIEDTERAILLSPLDPQRYYYDSLAATAYLAANQFERAIELAKRSLRANRTHTSTLRALAIAQWRLGKRKDARNTVTELRRLQPNLTIDSYLKNHPAAEYNIGKQWAKALRHAGVPDQ